MDNDGNEIAMIFFFSLGSQCSAGSVCITALHGTNEVEFMCVHFASKLQHGSEKMDVLSQVDNRKEFTMDIGCCCWKWILRPEAGSACDLTFVWGWMGGWERLMPETHLCYLLWIFPFFDRKKQAWKMGELYRVPWRKAICFGRTEIVNAWLFCLVLFLFSFNYVAPVCSLHFLLVSHVFVQGNL